MNPIVLLLGDSQTPTNFDGEVGEKRASEATVILNFPFRFAWIFLAMQTWGGDTGWGGVILHRDNRENFRIFAKSFQISRKFCHFH